MEITDAKTSIVTKFLSTSESITELTEYVEANKHELIKEHNISIDSWLQPGTKNRIMTVRKNVRHDPGFLIEQGMNAEVYKFVEQAYLAGVNIIIAGETSSGKTSLLNTLMDSSKSYDPTVLVTSFDEMKFGYTRKEIIKLIGKEDESLVNHAITMNATRTVLDEMYSATNDFTTMRVMSGQGKQFIMAVHAFPVAKADEKEKLYDTAVNYQSDHPFEIRVDIKLERKNGERIPSIVAVHELVLDKGQTTMRTLFSGDKFIQDPTRSIRRKLEGKTRRQKEPMGNAKLRGSETPTLMAVTEAQRKELIAHKDALSAFLHETGDYEAIAHFNALDEFLSRLK